MKLHKGVLDFGHSPLPLCPKSKTEKEILKFFKTTDYRRKRKGIHQLTRHIWLRSPKATSTHIRQRRTSDILKRSAKSLRAFAERARASSAFGSSLRDFAEHRVSEILLHKNFVFIS